MRYQKKTPQKINKTKEEEKAHSKTKQRNNNPQTKKNPPLTQTCILLELLCGLFPQCSHQEAKHACMQCLLSSYNSNPCMFLWRMFSRTNHNNHACAKRRNLPYRGKLIMSEVSYRRVSISVFYTGHSSNKVHIS